MHSIVLRKCQARSTDSTFHVSSTPLILQITSSTAPRNNTPTLFHMSASAHTSAKGFLTRCRDRLVLAYQRLLKFHSALCHSI